ncbi:MAG TPA: nucleotide exchange factor GrpE [Candidatus Paceibacterota bacterium]|nr:nucleotide exchange factor GrpE [Candidatus Paceibacterota bacterium]
MTNDEVKTEAKTVEKEKFLRLAADFENFRKEQARMQEEMAKFASQAMTLRMLEVLDTLQEAVAQAPGSVRENTDWFAGLENTVAQFRQVLQKAGAEPMDISGGAELDPVTMEAVTAVPGGASGTVQSVQRAGWTMHGRVIRPARVIVYQ